MCSQHIPTLPGPLLNTPRKPHKYPLDTPYPTKGTYVELGKWSSVSPWAPANCRYIEHMEQTFKHDKKLALVGFFVVGRCRLTLYNQS